MFVLLGHWSPPPPARATNDHRLDRSQGSASTIAFVGDLIFQNELQRAAMARGPSYRLFWAPVDSIFRAVDAVYGNVEGTIADDVTYRGDRTTLGAKLPSEVYTTPPSILNFNYHRNLAADLTQSRFRVISTGNNHALDRGSAGVDQTIRHLERAGIVAVGTRHSGGKPADWGKITRIGSFNIGWVACTYGTNGHPDPLDQVLGCYAEREQVLAAIKALSARPDVAAVFFVPHWGIEDHLVIARRQTSLAREAIEAGATAVIGTHPHILQQWEWVTSSSGRKALVVYSTGNFISAQTLAHQRNGLILLIALQMNRATVKAEISSAGYVLTEFDPNSGQLSLAEYSRDRHFMLPAEARLTAGQLEDIRNSSD